MVSPGPDLRKAKQWSVKIIAHERHLILGAYSVYLIRGVLEGVYKGEAHTLKGARKKGAKALARVIRRDADIKKRQRLIDGL